MQTLTATSAGSDKPNEDYAATGEGWAVTLDGATHFPGVDSGCIHNVPWLVRHLAAGIVNHLLIDDMNLPDILASAIESTCKAHADTCDLANPDSPSSTVAIIRTTGSNVEYLVLGDSPVMIRTAQGLKVIDDDRTDHLPGGRPYSVDLVRRMRNATGGFWVASTNVHAAYEALSGSMNDAIDFAMATDGVTRLIDYYGWNDQDLFSALCHQGPGRVIEAVRKAENDRPLKHGKRHDDATAVYGRNLAPATVPMPLALSL